MNKLVQHVTTTGLAAVAVGGVLLAGGEPAMAAPPQHSGHSGHPAAVTAERHPARRPASHQRVDPWVMGQLRMFDPAAAHRLAVYDPWVKDQLTRFAGQVD
ncbi:hypothetical protein ACIRFH_10745 [Streptomyces sp. NPDC093586]|uniref:hypothetical protein n=1 Tax=Streptomyces sp. NPDC093586 TaxID=3366042 RepID=UPI0038218353